MYSSKLIITLTIISLPLILFGNSLQVLLTDTFLHYEYSKIDFPKDMFGMNQDQRFELAAEVNSIVNSYQSKNRTSSLLSTIQLPDEHIPAFNTREVTHLVEVNNVINLIRILSLLSVIGVIYAGILAWKKRRSIIFTKALMVGGILSCVLILGAFIFAILSWKVFFLNFHEMLFTPGTWMFYENDTLIRLYPEKFWYDSAIILGLLIIIQGGVISSTGYFILKRAKTA